MKPFELLLLYNVIAIIITVIVMIICKKTIKSEKTKDLVLKIVSILVVVLHFSSVYVDFFTGGGSATIGSNMILPVYPCNIVMWLLVIVAFMKNKESKVYQTLSEFTFIGGTLCGLVGVLFNFNFLDNPTFADYSVLKGLLSHSVMVFGTVYLFVFKYAKLEVVRTTKSIFFGLLIFTACGLVVNVLFDVFSLPSVNAMYMQEAPFPEVPFLNFFTIGILAMLLSFIGLNIYEIFTLPKEERFITKILNKRRK